MTIVIGTIVLATLISNNLKPVIKTVCSNQARILCTSTINQAVVDEIASLNIKYSELVSLSRDTSGQITAIETNAIEVNKLKAELTDAVNERLKLLPQQNVNIPLGTLTGLELLSGRGPRVRLKMIPSSYVESSVANKFDSAGINQTRHQVMLEFSVSMTAILAPYSSAVVVNTNVCIAETIIIGAVPEMFADF
ncbi:MAG: sporulation protein YunB [Oscillospiraceae bacterium]